MVTQTALDQNAGVEGASRGEERPKRRSYRSVVVLILVATPIVYALSYAPTVRLIGRTEQSFVRPPAVFNYSFDATMLGQAECADASLYPAYQPVDLMIDNVSPIREFLFFWAQLWGVRDAFENGRMLRTTGVLWKQPEEWEGTE
jgi:hypothetical protein